MIKLSNISFSYEKKREVLKNISLEIKEGETLFLMGENGSGKSSLMLLMNGINKPFEGEYIFKNEVVKYNKKNLRELREKIGIVFQDPDMQLIAPDVESDVQFGPLNLGWNLKKVDESVHNAMVICDVVHLRNRECHSLSYGEKRRVAIAGVLAMDPEVIIFDEPTTWLDPYHQREFKDLLKKLQENNKTLIISTHDIPFAQEFKSRYIFLKKGEIISDGDIELFENDDLLEECRLK
ncbi:ABC transporter ATP-binding protein [Cetobacterium sp. 2A]|uniref:energy-coupling factor ABC transporter ATP-binding protein n=1 Tax=Cetobacterium sp. 2A TaxID=2754723 RepID=UPI00163BBF8F|nr:ABC transporter ATP-binding protein [Cetobacterium sp. 2A]MBC2855100.1 ABC transporter ATP-binding protein [Cetobacterium sp. 2A]